MSQSPTDTVPTLKEGRMKPCCLAISAQAVPDLGREIATRKWRVLSLDDQSELASGQIDAAFDDLLMVIREKAATAARGIGYDPQQFILDQ